MAAALPSAACVLLVLLPLSPPPVEAPMPGTFFWKPRVALDLATKAGGAPKPKAEVKAPTAQSIRDGYSVGIDGFRLAMAATALASYIAHMDNAFPQMHPCRAHYWTNVYRWALRYLSLIPDWLGDESKFVATHKVWRKRFHKMDAFVPTWLRPLLLCVSDESWKLEEKEWAKFVKYAEPHFGKYYRYPSKKFNNYKSFLIEDADSELSDASIQ